MTFSTLPINFEDGRIMHSLLPTEDAFFMVDIASLSGSLCMSSPQLYFLNPISGAISRKTRSSAAAPARSEMMRASTERISRSPHGIPFHWAALRAGRDVAAALDDRDYPGQHGAGQGFDPVYSRRYDRLRELSQKQYLANLWQNDVGAWSSAEANGVNRPRPHTCEQNYAIRRGLIQPGVTTIVEPTTLLKTTAYFPLCLNGIQDSHTFSRNLVHILSFSLTPAMSTATYKNNFLKSFLKSVSTTSLLQ